MHCTCEGHMRPPIPTPASSTATTATGRRKSSMPPPLPTPTPTNTHTTSTQPPQVTHVLAGTCPCPSRTGEGQVHTHMHGRTHARTRTSRTATKMLGASHPPPPLWAREGAGGPPPPPHPRPPDCKHTTHPGSAGRRRGDRHLRLPARHSHNVHGLERWGNAAVVHSPHDHHRPRVIRGERLALNQTTITASPAQQRVSGTMATGPSLVGGIARQDVTQRSPLQPYRESQQQLTSGPP
jgi:hypothetical protein